MLFSFMSFSCPSASVGEALRMASEYGYDGFEPRIDVGHGHGLEIGAGAGTLRDARKAFEDLGKRICCVATSCSYVDPDAAARDRAVERAKRAIDLAAALGAPAIRVFGGLPPKGASREACLENVVGSLSKIAGQAASAGVAVCVETHDGWCDPAWMARVMGGVDHPGVAVNWDIMHPVLTSGYTVADSYGILKRWVMHVHAHDGVLIEPAGDGYAKTELRAMGSGDVDHGAALRLLGEDGYSGYVSGEWINWEPPEVHLPRELGRLRGYLR
ncbi:MAG: sugar phosphate isomerase/epimerase [Oscillospiraceae bacterium]|nr:sugar phosphate isomerase/epimerase [Oscillospiraceae bacterium]